jgi:hypothetical protein
MRDRDRFLVTVRLRAVRGKGLGVVSQLIRPYRGLRTEGTGEWLIRAIGIRNTKEPHPARGSHPATHNVGPRSFCGLQDAVERRHHNMHVLSKAYGEMDSDRQRM